jgi:hypothetical protein
MLFKSGIPSLQTRPFILGQDCNSQLNIFCFNPSALFEIFGVFKKGIVFVF